MQTALFVETLTVHLAMKHDATATYFQTFTQKADTVNTAKY
jgi:hypothetical protein